MPDVTGALGPHTTRSGEATTAEADAPATTSDRSGIPAADGLADARAAASQAARAAAAPADLRPATPRTVSGIGVVPGIAYAPVVWKRGRPQTVPHTSLIAEQDRDAEIAALEAAVDGVATRLEARAREANGAAAGILGASAALARDSSWRRGAAQLVRGGMPAAPAVIAAIEQFVATFEKLGGSLAERTTDLRDIRGRIVAELLDLPEPGVPSPRRPSILFADDLAPADTVGLDAGVITALVTRLGGPTSHTAIVARQLGIPCIVAAADIGAIAEGTPVLVDGSTGTITVGVASLEGDRLVAADADRREAARTWRGPAGTLDGREIELLVNVQDGEDARSAARSQATGVGLFRTEMCFLSSPTEPSVQEQSRIYAEVFAAFPDHKVVVRTLDAGSDKPLAFAPAAAEENPALGLRGVRMGLRHPGLLTRQLDAIAEAAGTRSGANEPAWVMAPMIATIPEAQRFAALARARGIVPGVMVEVPSAALLADAFLEHVDFLSIGTNDLAQYAMAADRMSPLLAELTDPWQPAVLTLVAMTARAGRAAGKTVGVCGEAAADPMLACVLVGLGISSLSMASSAISIVGAQLATVTVEQCERAARAALSAPDAADARLLARAALDAAT